MMHGLANFKVSKYINLKTAFKTNNSRQYNLRHPQTPSKKKKLNTIIANYLLSCIYELIYPESGKAYVEQTGRVMPRGLKNTIVLLGTILPQNLHKIS